MNPDFPEVLIGIAELAVALAGFTGVVVAFGSRQVGTWHPGDKLRLAFLLEASLTAGGFALLSLLLYTNFDDESKAWAVASGSWVLYMLFSLYRSRELIVENLEHHDDVDIRANHLVFTFFALVMALQLANVLLWQQFGPLLAAIVLNLAGAAMQFVRLIRAAYRE